MERAPTDTPALNGLMESTKNWMTQGTTAALMTSGLPITFWDDAYLVTEMVINKTPSKTILGFLAPDQLLTKKEPDWSHFRVFGCKAWVINPKRTKRKDFLPPAEVGHLVGYSMDPIGWRIYIPSQNKEVVSVNVRFDENIPTPSEAYFAELNRM